MITRGKPYAPDKGDQFPKPTDPGTGNNGGGNNSPLAQYTVFPQAMPGQLGLLAQQLQAGFGTPNTTTQDFRENLRSVYSPMRVQTNQQFGQTMNGNGNGNGNNGGGNRVSGLTMEQIQRMQMEDPERFGHAFPGGLGNVR